MSSRGSFRFLWRLEAALCTGLALLCGGGAYAQSVPHTDVLIQTGCAPLCVGGFDFVEFVSIAEQQAFPVVLGVPDDEEENEEPTRYETTSPGFYSRTDGLPPGWGPLPVDRDLVYEFLSIPELGCNLCFWDGGTFEDEPGVEDVDPGPLPSAEVLVGQVSVGFLEFELTVADGSDVDVGDSQIAATNAETGGLHDHISFFLYGDDTPVLDPQLPAADAPTDGIYFASLGLSLHDPDGVESILEAPPVFVAFQAGDVAPGALSAAAEWIETTLVPEPRWLSLYAAAGLTLVWLRRRRARRALGLPLLLLVGLIPTAPRAEMDRLDYTEGHVDLEVGVVEQPELALESYLFAEGATIGDEVVPGPEPFGAEEITIVVPDASRQTLSEDQIEFFGLEPIGAEPGAPLWILPQDQGLADAQGAPFLGIAGREIKPGQLVDDLAELVLVEMVAPEGAQFSAYQSSFQRPTPFAIATSDGIGPEDHITVGAGSHDHFNLGFTEPGEYALRFEAQGSPVSDPSETLVTPVTYVFRVPEPSAFGGAAAATGALVGLNALRRRRVRFERPRGGHPGGLAHVR